MRYFSAIDLAEMKLVLHSMLAILPLEELVSGLQDRASDSQLRQAMREMLATWPPEERLERFSPEELLQALSAEKLERLRQLLQAQTEADAPLRPDVVLCKEAPRRYRREEPEFVLGMREILATMSPEERLEVLLHKARRERLSPKELLQVLPLEVWLWDLSPEEILRALSPGYLDRLRQLLQAQTHADTPSRPE